jgi:hypothetical protein
MQPGSSNPTNPAAGKTSLYNPFLGPRNRFVMGACLRSISLLYTFIPL